MHTGTDNKHSRRRGKPRFDFLRNGTWRFVIALGLVSLFGDFTYEGGRSIVGPYLGQLGASAFLVGLIAGGGEFLGYLVRLLSGRIVDRTQRHWTAIYVGYLANLVALPLLSLATALGPAGALVFAERLGKGLRTPARDAVLARGAADVGHGKAFGVHEAMDQTGAVLGPLMVALAVSVTGAYRWGFAGLAIPAAICLLLLRRCHRLDPHAAAARETAETAPESGEPRAALPRAYYHYLAFAAVMVVGFAHFQLAAFRLHDSGLVSSATIPLLFALCMAADAVAALIAGFLYDRVGLSTLIVLPVLAMLGTAGFFLGQGLSAFVPAAIAWGAALGMQEGTMRAAVATMVPLDRLAQAYGLFDAVFGACWLAGSLLFGALYMFGGPSIAGASIGIELIALMLLLYGAARRRRG